MDQLSISRLLIANRGEIAVRIARSAAEQGLEVVTVAPSDDLDCLHTRRSDLNVVLDGHGVKAYLDFAQIVKAALANRCDAIHPGYGFLSENAEFAQACADNGLRFVGPEPHALTIFGDKAAARSLAKDIGVATPEGVYGEVDLAGAKTFMEGLEPGAKVVLKAIAGGGGRGIRVVNSIDELENAFERCSSEATSSFGYGGLYVERYIAHARHIEVQIVGDGSGAVSQIGERECSLQRRHQKIVEIAPSPSLPEGVRAAILADAVKLGEAVKYRSLGTIEFLAWQAADKTWRHAFIEANPRIQVEHTVTEAVTGLDLVKVQLAIASGATLEAIGLAQHQVPLARGYAIQLRVNAEQMTATGAVMPSSGTMDAFDIPAGPGVRVDTLGYAGYALSPNYDSLLAKVIVHSDVEAFEAAVTKAKRALREFRIAGIKSNKQFLLALMERPDVAENAVYTTYIDEHVAALVTTAENLGDDLHFAFTKNEAVLATRFEDEETGDGEPVRAPLRGTVVSVKVDVGQAVSEGTEIAVLEAMKMEHSVTAHTSGIITSVSVEPGDVTEEGRAVIWIEPREGVGEQSAAVAEIDLDYVRPDLQELFDRRHKVMDEGRPGAVARRHKRNKRTARENIADLVDAGTFVEYGPLVTAAMRARFSEDELLEKSPADGLITGIGSINGEIFGSESTRCAVMSYDTTVFAGTQGREAHRKDMRLVQLAAKSGLPLVMFTEGGGGRPGQTESLGDNWSFNWVPALSGKVPMIAITQGHCYAGNACYLGAADVVIATHDATIGMGGPAMVEGGGLGVFTPEEIGPARMHYKTGVIDLMVEDEIEAVRMARNYLGYFQGKLSTWKEHDQRIMRTIVPEDRRRAYEMRKIINTLADVDSVLELRAGFGQGMITCLARVEGRPIGIVANNPNHLGGAVDSDGSDKGARFLQICDAFGLPVVYLADTPGIMVGPEAERTAIVRRSARFLSAGANLKVPCFTFMPRKAYGIGVVAMRAGAWKAPIFSVAWPTAEFGGMGIEGAVVLAYRREMDAISDPVERKTYYESKVNELYQQGKALAKANTADFDDVIDPAESRNLLAQALTWSDAGRIKDRRTDYPFIG